MSVLILFVMDTSEGKTTHCHFICFLIPLAIMSAIFSAFACTAFGSSGAALVVLLEPDAADLAVGAALLACSLRYAAWRSVTYWMSWSVDASASPVGGEGEEGGNGKRCRGRSGASSDLGRTRFDVCARIVFVVVAD